MDEKLITVTGKGSICVEPDVTRLDLTLQSLHDTYEEAYEQAKSNTQRLSTIMKEVALDMTLPKTICLDIEKKFEREYDKFGNFKNHTAVGFELEHKVRIDLPMDNVLLNSIVKLVGNLLKQAEISIGYTVRDPRPFQLKILKRAVQDAKEKASIMAEACDCTLGLVKRIDYSVQELYIYSKARQIHGADEALCCNTESLDITPADLSASDEVTVVWHLLNNAKEK